MTEKKQTRRGTDWETQLKDDEKGVDRQSGKPVVYLRGLQRLAEEADIVTSSCSLLTPSPKLVQAVYQTTFSDGTTWVGTADCGPANTKAPFLNYPTSVAESRAEARCLRKALGIRTLSFEEIGMQEPFSEIAAKPDASVSDQVVASIVSLCETRGVEQADLIEQIVTSDRAAHIFELKHLTSDEGQRAMAWLNDQPVAKAKKKTVAQQRADRKKELKDKHESTS